MVTDLAAALGHVIEKVLSVMSQRTPDLADDEAGADNATVPTGVGPGRSAPL